MLLKIGTLNLKNDEINRKSIDNGLIVANHIKNEHYDILGTQELTKHFTNKIKENLGEYKFYGKYRYNKIISKIKKINDFNENNNIITKHKVIKTKTKKLPSIPFNIKKLIYRIKNYYIISRIMTISLIKIENKKIVFINTHLDYRFDDIKIRQYKYLIKQIKKYLKYSIILTGDFNAEKDNKLFKEFINELEKLNIKRIEINDKTNERKYKAKTAIDHIFISKDFKVIEKGINNLDDITDHKGLFAVVEINN